MFTKIIFCPPFSGSLLLPYTIRHVITSLYCFDYFIISSLGCQITASPHAISAVAIYISAAFSYYAAVAISVFHYRFHDAYISRLPPLISYVISMLRLFRRYKEPFSLPQTFRAGLLHMLFAFFAAISLMPEDATVLSAILSMLDAFTPLRQLRCRCHIIRSIAFFFADDDATIWIFTTDDVLNICALFRVYFTTCDAAFDATSIYIMLITALFS